MLPESSFTGAFSVSSIQRLHHDFDWAMRAIRTHRAVLVLDLAGYIIAVNRHCLQMCGYRREELVGLPVVILLDPSEKGPNRLCRILEAPDGQEVQLHDLAQVTKAGRRFRVDARLCPVQDANGQVCLNVLFLRETAGDQGPLRAGLLPDAPSAQVIRLPERETSWLRPSPLGTARRGRIIPFNARRDH